MSKTTKQGVATLLAKERPGIPAEKALRAVCAERLLTQAKICLSSADPSSQSWSGQDVAMSIALSDPTSKNAGACHEALARGHGLPIDMPRQLPAQRRAKLSFID